MPVAALILGILAILLPGLGLLVGVVAIVLGVVAVNRHGVDGGPPPRKGMAIGGIATGGAGIALWALVMPGLLIPAIALARRNASETADLAAMRQIVVACIAYGEQHDVAWPPDLDALARDQALPATMFRARIETGVPLPHFLYVRPTDDAAATTVVLVANPELHPRRLLCAYADAHTATIAGRGGRDVTAMWNEAQRLAASPEARGDGVPASAWSAAWSR